MDKQMLEHMDQFNSETFIEHLLCTRHFPGALNSKIKQVYLLPLIPKTF